MNKKVFLKKRGIVWFRQDLRLHDHEAIHEALALCDEVIYIYIFDPRMWNGKTDFGLPKTGKARKQFIVESIRNLKSQLDHFGGRLHVEVGLPEELIYEYARLTKVNWIFCNRERTKEEKDVQDRLEKELWGIGVEMCYSRGKMLYYTQDLPFPVNHTPDQFTAFRKEVEKFIPIREPLPTPSQFKSVEMPDFVEKWPDHVEQPNVDFEGGETAGLDRLQYYLWETDHVKTYKETRNGLVDQSHTSRFSPWLAQGCLSPKMVHSELKKYEEKNGANESTYWIYFELLWRDFFRLMGKKHGNRIFQLNGYSTSDKKWKEDDDLFHAWAEGRTGTPLVDAAMRQLKLTGWMSNRARQVSASFLVNDLKLNWLMGAEWFESHLIDYDVCSNYGNWAYLAGVGSDTRDHRYFNVLSQSKKYDAKGQFIRQWIPELSSLPDHIIHSPDAIEGNDEAFKELPEIYMNPIISSLKWQYG